MARCFQPITGVSVWSLNQVEGWFRPAWVPVNDRSHATERNAGLALQSVTSKELAIFHGVGFAIIHFRWVGNRSQTTRSLRSSAGLALQSLNFANKELAIFHGVGFAINRKLGACDLSVGGLCDPSQTRNLRSFTGLALQSFTNKEFAIFTGLALQSVTSKELAIFHHGVGFATIHS